MILYCTTNRTLELWYLDLVSAMARPPASPTVYALVSYETPKPRYYVGSSTRFTARLGAHLSFARSRKLRGNSAGGRHLAPVLAKRERALVIILETCPGADSASLLRREQAWIIAAIRDCGEGALAYQVPATTAPMHGPHAPATLAARRQWPGAWVDTLGEFFRQPRRPEAVRLVRPSRLSAGGPAVEPRAIKPASRQRRRAGVQRAAP